MLEGLCGRLMMIEVLGGGPGCSGSGRVLMLMNFCRFLSTLVNHTKTVRGRAGILYDFKGPRHAVCSFLYDTSQKEMLNGVRTSHYILADDSLGSRGRTLTLEGDLRVHGFVQP